jgi:hypothetical protein
MEWNFIGFRPPFFVKRQVDQGAGGGGVSCILRCQVKDWGRTVHNNMYIVQCGTRRGNPAKIVRNVPSVKPPSPPSAFVPESLCVRGY